MLIKDDQLIFRCSRCKKNYKKYFNKDLIKRFANIYKFCDKDITKFIFVIKKKILSIWIHGWLENETSLPAKEAIYSNLNLKYIKNIDYRHTMKK